MALRRFSRARFFLAQKRPLYSIAKSTYALSANAGSEMHVGGAFGPSHVLFRIVARRAPPRSPERRRMVEPRREATSSVPAIRLRPISAPAQPAEQPISAETAAIFNFDGTVEGVSYPSLSPAQQDVFKADFLRELASIKTWAREQQWLSTGPAE